MSTTCIDSGGLVAEHVLFALCGAIVVAQVPGALSALAWLCSARHSCGVNARGPPSAHPALAARYFQSAANGLWLHYRVWEPRTPVRAVVYFVHGYGEHCGRYEQAARALADAGFRVASFDQQGHGASVGDRGHLDRLASCVSDVIQLAESVCPPPPNVPRVLMGHSMGGLISLLVVAK